MTPLRVCIGYDPRQAVAFSVLAHSILRHASRPVAIIPLVIEQLPVSPEMQGLTPFTFTRYLTPWVCGFEGLAVFMDSDMIVRGDIHELFEFVHTGTKPAVWVIPHEKRFERPSVMVFECERPPNRKLTPEYVVEHHRSLPAFSWLDSEEQIGELPREWNHLVLYDEPNPDAKAIHFTAGLPVHPEIHGCEHTETFGEELQLATKTLDWNTLMGRSVHVPAVQRHLVATGKLEADFAPPN